jgi:hypothetical protein
MMLTVALIASAVAVMLWPKPSAVTLPDSALASDPHVPAKVSYQVAMAQLATVRLRLLQTEQLGDAEKQSIDTLTLALVAGSDK